MRLLAALSLLLIAACPGPPVEPPASDAGGEILDSGPAEIDAGPEEPNPCGCVESQSCSIEFLDCEEPEVCEEDGDCVGERICVQGNCYDCWGGERAACTVTALYSDGRYGRWPVQLRHVQSWRE